MLDKLRSYFGSRGKDAVQEAVSGYPTHGRVMSDQRRKQERRPRPVTIVVPVFNAYEDVELCLNSLVERTGHPHEILLIDDRSTDDRVWPMLRAFSKAHPNVQAARNRHNLGYTRTINIACLMSCPHDVVLLNSDTIVSPAWLEQLCACAYSRPKVGTVTPLSNAAGAFSIPVNNASNEIPQGLDIPSFAAWVSRLSSRVRPEVPTGNGFCLYIRRELLDRIDWFDEERFPRGYGEENDFCMRARAAGFLNLVDDSTFVYHKRSASFGENKGTLIQKAKQTLKELHPSYNSDVKQWLANDPVDGLRQLLQKEPWKEPQSESPARKRLLYLVHSGGGGTTFTSEDLIRGLQQEFDCFLVETSDNHWTLSQTGESGLVPIRRYHFEEPWRYFLPASDSRIEVLRDIISSLRIDLAHFRHMIGNGPNALGAAKEMGVPVVFSLHDFYTICPTTTLLDDHGRYCEGTCTPGDGECTLHGRWFAGGTPHLKHAFVHTHRKIFQDAFRFCTALVTTSDDARRLVLKHYPELADRFQVIEHGRDLIRNRGAQRAQAGTKIGVACLGVRNVWKGLGIVRKLLEMDAAGDGRFEFHFFGPIAAGEAEELQKLGAILHGRYQRDDLQKLLNEAGCSLGIVPSIWPETYCHTLTELWAASLPVFASDLGALQERIRRHGGGWLLNHQAPEEWHAKMVDIVDTPGEFEGRCHEVDAIPKRTVMDMAIEYADLYRSLLRKQTNE